MFTPFAYIKQPTSGTPPPPPPATVTWKYRYVASADGSTRQKTASNLYFVFQDVTYARGNQTFIGSTSTTTTISSDNNTGTGQFDIYRDLCRGTSGTGTPKIDEYLVRVYRNGSQIYLDNINLLNPNIPTCPTQDSRSKSTGGGFTVSAGDEIIVEWTDNLTV